MGSPLDVPAERVAVVRLARLEADREPMLALLGGAVRPGLGIDLALRLLLDPVVADGGRGVSACPIWSSVGGWRKPVDAAWLTQTPGVAVGLELRSDRMALRARPPPPGFRMPWRFWM